MHAFDRAYWDQHYRDAGAPGASPPPPNPHLLREVTAIAPGTALDAGCGEGAEALWLAEQGWDVLGVDIAAEALARAREHAGGATATGRVRWLQADLSTWQPDRRFDLVTTHYAHPAMPQLDFYERLGGWVAPGGTLLVVGHLHRPDGAHGATGHPGHGNAHGEPPESATVTADDVVARLDPAAWEVVTAEERVRSVVRGGEPVPLEDVVVRATRSG